MKVVHIITRMIVGGAQENTLLNCIDLIEHFSDDVTLITGPSEGREGQLLERFNHPQLKIVEASALTRNIHPWQDWKANTPKLRLSPCSILGLVPTVV